MPFKARKSVCSSVKANGQKYLNDKCVITFLKKLFTQIKSFSSVGPVKEN